MEKLVYAFKDGSKEMKDLLGGKGANLAEMTNIGLPVPPGFTISTKACHLFFEKNQQLWPDLIETIQLAIQSVEQAIGKRFDDSKNPLLFSIRSGAVISMPGMMDTILNLGLNDQSVEGLAIATTNRRFALDSYRRFIQMFSDVAMSIPKYLFDNVLENKKQEKGIYLDTDLTEDDLMEIIDQYKAIYQKERHESFPQDPVKQLILAIEAVFRSWNNPRARIYRDVHHIPHHLGTAVNVQSMVFGNMGNDSGTGVAFSRNPATGEAKLFGEYLMNAQGEDVVAGIRTPQDINQLAKTMPDLFQQFVATVEKLENHYKDMQDIEFTIEKGKLYFLQTRIGKRTAHAAINIAVDLVEEGKIDRQEAIMRIEAKQLDQLLHPNFDEKSLEQAVLITKGLPASPGAATGKVYFNASEVVAANKTGEKVILVRQETSPEDIEGMVAAQGILTARGGMTSHAAVVARGMGKCCVVGCNEIRVDEASKTIKTGEGIIREGDIISINGNSGNIYLGEIPKVEPQLSGKFAILMDWVDECRRLRVRTNADTPKDATTAVLFGAEGIGLCRTEHMFFDKKRIFSVRKMILASDHEMRKKFLEELLPYQREDFYHIYQAMQGRPVTIRLLDPPLHEFLPNHTSDIEALAKDMGISLDVIYDKIESLHEFNPMLGHRGCRLAITFPEIYNMQVRAIIEAAIEFRIQDGCNIEPEIMIPLIGDCKELAYVKENIMQEIRTVFEEKQSEVKYHIGTMIEIPRAALTADEIAEQADFFSFGTNDMTQMGFGFSRDDAGKFLPDYESLQIFDRDPFESLDTKGIGKLLDIATSLGKKTNADLKIGICGEHGGDPDSILFCEKLGLDYVSCSPFRVPIARLAAAQAAIKN